MNLTMDAVARVAYATERAYCHITKTATPVPWDQLPPWELTLQHDLCAAIVSGEINHMEALYVRRRAAVLRQADLPDHPHRVEFMKWPQASGEHELMRLRLYFQIVRLLLTAVV